MPIFHKKEMELNFNYHMASKQKGEICVTFHRQEAGYAWYKKDGMNIEMKRWRKLAKDGKLKISKCNNQDFNYNGEMYYTFLIQTYNNNDCGLDPILSLVFGYFVSGYGYIFKTKENRDSIYNYVMKDIEDTF
jgi:hypothetical protein